MAARLSFRLKIAQEAVDALIVYLVPKTRYQEHKSDCILRRGCFYHCGLIVIPAAGFGHVRRSNLAQKYLPNQFQKLGKSKVGLLWYNGPNLSAK